MRRLAPRVPALSNADITMTETGSSARLLASDCRPSTTPAASTALANLNKAPAAASARRRPVARGRPRARSEAGKLKGPHRAKFK